MLPLKLFALSCIRIQRLTRYYIKLYVLRMKMGFLLNKGLISTAKQSTRACVRVCVCVSMCVTCFTYVSNIGQMQGNITMIVNYFVMYYASGNIISRVDCFVGLIKPLLHSAALFFVDYQTDIKLICKK